MWLSFTDGAGCLHEICPILYNGNAIFDLFQIISQVRYDEPGRFDS